MNVVMGAEGKDIVLSDFSGGQVYLENEKNTLYDVSKQGVLLNHNKSIVGAYLEEGKES